MMVTSSSHYCLGVLRQHGPPGSSRPNSTTTTTATCELIIGFVDISRD